MINLRKFPNRGEGGLVFRKRNKGAGASGMFVYHSLFLELSIGYSGAVSF